MGDNLAYLIIALSGIFIAAQVQWNRTNMLRGLKRIRRCFLH